MNTKEILNALGERTDPVCKEGAAMIRSLLAMIPVEPLHPMKTFRRLDDLGRVVIPREARRMMGLKDGTPMEFFSMGDMICLRPYTPVEGDEE